MPSRRNARNNKQHSHIYQQPTPSSRPSPDMYSSSLPEDSAGSSGDDAGERSVERSSESSGSETRGTHREEQESDSEPRQSLPTPPLPDFIAESPLSPLWDDSGTSNGQIRSPILSSLAEHANKNKSFLGDAFTRAGTASGTSSPTSPTTTVTIPISSPPAARPIATGPSSNSSVRARTNVTSISVDSPEVRAPTIAYSDRTAHSNDLSFDLDPQHMEGTIRPSMRAFGHGHGYGYGYPVENVDLDRESNEDTAGYVNSSAGRTRPRRAPQYEQSTIRTGSGISRAMAQPDVRRQPQPQRAPQAETTRPVIPVSINGAPDEGDPIVSARWDHGLNGRRLLFLFYYPSGMQIWDCTDLGSITEVLSLPSESVRQLIADDSILRSASEDTSGMIIEYAGIISQGSGEAPLLGILLTPTDEKRDPVDEASDSVLLSAEDDLVSRDPECHDNHSFILIYSLVDHHVVKRIRIPGLSIGGGQFQVGNGFIVASTTVPPSLHVLSSTTFDVLHHIPPSHLQAFCHKPPSPSSYGGLSPSSQRHSFLETTSNIVNGIYNNYNDHFNDNYQNNNNQRNNVLLPTTNHVDVFSSSSSATGGYPGGQSLDPARQRRATMYGQASQARELVSIAIPLPIPETTTPLPAPVFSVSGRLLAYASLPEGNNTSSSLGATGVGAGVQPRTSSTLSSAAVSTASAFGSTLSAQLAHLGGSAGGGASGALGALGGISQADVGNAALKVGGSVLSGMKSLGGLAYKSAVAAATDSGSRGGAGSRAGAGTGVGGLANRFFSRSAPAATSSTKNQDRDRRFSIANSNALGGTGTGIEDYRYDASEAVSSDKGSGRPLSVLPRTVPVMESGYHVSVLDLTSLVTDISLSRTATAATIQARSPLTIMQFIASKSQPVSSIWFSPSGTSFLIATRDGQTIQVFEIRSDPVQQVAGNDEGQRDTTLSSHDRSKKRTVSGHSWSSSSTDSNLSQGSAPLHVYNLRRGRTPAVIESADWSSDGRWVAIGTRRRTVHIFAVNPYGGNSDIQSHIDGKVRNLTELPAMPSDLHPLIRLRVMKNPSPNQLRVPLAFSFLEPSVESERYLPPNLLPPISSPHISPTHLHSYGSVSSTHTVMSSSPSTRSEPLSPRQQLSPNGRPRNFQDVLVFDPTDGLLSLRRITSEVKLKAKEGPSILGASFSPVNAGSMSASRSLPAGIGGRLSISPSHGTSPLHGRMVAPSNTPSVETPGELMGKENTIASWNLRRGKDWSEKKEALETLKKKKSSEITAGHTNWLAQAELSTYSRAPRVLPRSIYLSHQFSFRVLGEDYHALIRRYQFDVTGSKIEVRKGVEVSAYPTGNSESFVEGGGFAIHRDLRRLSSSFDEPLASALSAGLDYTPSQPVLPMFPNGTPGMNPRSLKNSIPIRTMSGLGDGMSEGIGRFRREINKVRSPQLRPSSDNSISTPVPLEFDEEDEDFMSPHEINQESPYDSSQSVSPGGGPSHEILSMRSHGDDVTISDDYAHDDQWPGWVGEDREAVDEVETFDDISAVGFMDEEIRAVKHAAPLSRKSKNQKKRN